jgi:hypothetical protein
LAVGLAVDNAGCGREGAGFDDTLCNVDFDALGGGGQRVRQLLAARLAAKAAQECGGAIAS